MTLYELLTERHRDEIERRDPVQLAYRRQALEAQRGGFRRFAAATLVRIGVWLDRPAAERLVAPRDPQHARQTSMPSYRTSH